MDFDVFPTSGQNSAKPERGIETFAACDGLQHWRRQNSAKPERGIETAQKSTYNLFTDFVRTALSPNAGLKLS